MTIAADFETTTPLEAGVNALSWAQQAETIHGQQLAVTNGKARPRHGLAVKFGDKPLGPLVGTGVLARAACERVPVAVLTPFRALSSGGWSGYGTSGLIPQERVAYGAMLYTNAEDYEPLPTDPVVSPPTHWRVFSIGLIERPNDAPESPRGTQALTVATHTLRTLAGYLTELAADAPTGEQRRYRTEAEIYTAHSQACQSQILRTLSWLPAFEQKLEPVPPFAPILIPAQLRGYVAVGPY